MLRFPHEPHDAAIALQLQATLSDLEATADPENLEESTGAADYLQERSEEYRNIAFLYYAYGSPLPLVVRLLRVSTILFQQACKAGATCDAFELWEAFHTATAVGAGPTAHFLASLPSKVWISSDSADWPVVQCRTAFALFREEEGCLPRLLEQLRAFVLDEPLPEEFVAFVPETQNTYHLLNALHGQDSAEFNTRLAQRTEIRAKIYRGEFRDDPEGLLDFPGLGLCRLARSRGMRTDIKSVYLPLPILDLPWESAT